MARLSEIPAEARPLVEHLIAARLLATDVSPETGERTIEPAHEALLRQWGLLQGWLEEDFAALSTLEGVKRAARDWEANGRDEAWLAHTAGRLDDAEALHAARRLRRRRSMPTDRAYLAAAPRRRHARRNRELEEARKLAEAQRKIAGRTRIGLVAASMLAVAAVGAAVFGFRERRRGAARQAADRGSKDRAPRWTMRPSAWRRSPWWRWTKAVRQMRSSWRWPPGRVPGEPIVPS